MSTLEKLTIGDGITALMTDGTVVTGELNQPMVETLLTHLQTVQHVPVEIADDNSAIKLLDQVALATGFHITRAPNGVFLDQPAVEDPSEPLPATKTRGGLIILSPKEVFTSCEKALGAILAWETQPKADLAGRYHQDLTQTFRNGKAEGQIQSIFRDIKKYGGQNIIGKLQAFRQHVKSSKDPMFKRYLAYLAHGFLPHHKETFVDRDKGSDGRTDMCFFKLWAILEVLKKFETPANG